MINKDNVQRGETNKFGRKETQSLFAKTDKLSYPLKQSLERK